MKTLNLTRGKQTTVDDEDFDLLRDYSWHPRPNKSGNWYVSRSPLVREKDVPRTATISLHRMIMERVLNRKLEKGELVDHRDNNGLNNIRENLRIASAQKNMFNRRCSGVSGFKGCYLNNNGKYFASIDINNRQKYLGERDTKEEAALLYDQAAYYYFGDFARPNFPHIPKDANWLPPIIHKHKRNTVGIKSIYRGVYWHKIGKKWAVYAAKGMDNSSAYGGLFCSEEEAAHKYDSMSWLVHGKAELLNFPERFICYG